MSDVVFGPLIFPPLGPSNGSAGPMKAKGWDLCVLGGQSMPGFSRILRGGIALKVDKKSKAGSHGANPTFHGLDPQPLQLEVQTFSDADREALASITLGIRSKLEKIATLSAAEQKNQQLQVAIDHPSLRAIGISAVVIMGMSALIVEGPMRAKMTFELLDWLPATGKATVTPSGAPVRKPKIVREGSVNPKPTEQPGLGNPPAGLKK